MEDSKKGLSASELMEGVYTALVEGGRSIKFSSEAKAEIAEDSDYHRIRIGYTAYDSVTILKLDDKNSWMIGLGHACGSYPAEPYDCDIVAVQIVGDDMLSDTDIDKKAHDVFEDNFYFKNSLIYAMADGQLGVKEKGIFGEMIIESLNKEINNFISQPLEFDGDRFYLDMRPVVKSAVLYKPEFVNFLYETFLSILRKKSV